MMTTEELDTLDALLREWNLSSASLADAQARLADESSGVASKHAWLAQGISRAERAVDAAGIAIADGIIPNIPRLLAAARQAETLRAKLAETEQARHEARYYGNEVAAERDNLHSRLNQAEHAAKMLTAERDRAQAESHTRLLQRIDAEKNRDYYRALVDGKAEERTQAAELQARHANDRARVMTDALKATEAERDALKAQRDELREAAIALAVWHGPSCDCNYGEYCTDHRFDDSTGCEACSVDERLQKALEAAR